MYPIGSFSGLPGHSFAIFRGAPVQAIPAHAALTCRDWRRRHGDTWGKAVACCGICVRFSRSMLFRQFRHPLRLRAVIAGGASAIRGGRLREAVAGCGICVCLSRSMLFRQLRHPLRLRAVIAGGGTAIRGELREGSGRRICVCSRSLCCSGNYGTHCAYVP